MDIELGIQNVARTVTFSTEQSADESMRLSPTRGERQDHQSDGRQGSSHRGAGSSLGYAIIGSETKHAVGFGNL